MDKQNNLLTIRLQGSIGKIEGEKVTREIVTVVNQLQRGFTVITDISSFTAADKKNDEILKKTMSFLKLRGVEKVIRVVGGSKTGLMQFAQVTKEVENYTVHYVPTMEEAVKFLASA